MTDLSEQEDRSSGFGSTQETVAVNVSPKQKEVNQNIYLNQNRTFVQYSRLLRGIYIVLTILTCAKHVRGLL